MIGTEIKLVNRIIAEAVWHGADSGGSYDQNEEELVKSIGEWLAFKGLCDKYTLKESENEDANFTTIQICEKDEKYERKKKDKKRRTAEYIGYSFHDTELWYRCPLCGHKFGSWTIFHQQKNENGTKNYCPSCKEELIGLE